MERPVQGMSPRRGKPLLEGQVPKRSEKEVAKEAERASRKAAIAHDKPVP